MVGFPMKKQRQWFKIFNVTSGNFFEMFDFMVFGMFAHMIAKSFFPSSSPYLSLMLSFVTFGTGFLMRPIGALVLGGFIDKYGRKRGLLVTLGLMAFGTFTIAFTPDYSQIGIVAPLLILLGRLIQGFSAGAELGGVSVYLSEIAPAGRKGFYVSWQSASQQLAVVCGALFGFVLSKILSIEQMAGFGWRIPFIFGCLVIPVVFFLRSYLQETESFKRAKHHPSINEIIRSTLANFPLIAGCSMMVMLTTVSFYMITAYTPTYAKDVIHLSGAKAFFITMCIGLANFIFLPLMGTLSDKVGRKKPLILFSGLFVLTAYPMLNWLVHNSTFNHMLVVELWFSLLYAGYNGAMVVALTEIVPANIRSISFSFAYSIATAIYGGFTPAIATNLIHFTDNPASPALWLTIAGACSLITVLILGNKKLL